MAHSIGLIELGSVAAGYQVCDTMLKTASNQFSTSVFQRDMVIDWVAQKKTLNPADYDDNRIKLVNTGK